MRDPDEAEGFGEQVSRIAGLAEPTRRALYRYVVSQPGPVGREQAAAATGVLPHVAKFHLDRLEADGLLESEYSRPPAGADPAPGRPPALPTFRSRPVGQPSRTPLRPGRADHGEGHCRSHPVPHTDRQRTA